MKPETPSWRARSGPVLRGLALLLHVPIAMAILSVPVCLFHDPDHWPALAITAAAGLVCGQPLYWLCRDAPVTQRHHALLIAALAWLAISAIGALPFIVAAPHVTVLDALFESLSAHTGTGLSVMAPEALPPLLQWWRSLAQWIGGVGVIVLLLAVLPPNRGSLELYYSEGRDDKIRPGVTATVHAIWSLYLAYTLAAIGLLWAAGEPPWHALNHGMTAIATGGMTVTDDGLAAAGTAVKIAYLPILIAGATSFAIHYRIWREGRFRAGLFGGLEQRLGWSILLVGIPLIVAQNHWADTAIPPVDSALHWISAATTAGFQSDDLGSWPLISMLWLLPVMVVGAMAGSTGGGLKLARVAMLCRAFLWSLQSLTRTPHQVMRFVCDGEALARADAAARVRAVTILAIGWGLLLVCGVLALAQAAPDWSLKEIVFEVVSAQNNVGLSTGATGPEAPAAAKIVLMLLMWMGRLEIVPAMVLLILFLERGLGRR